MKTVAVTAEFNPFHNGHKYLAEQIRLRFGPDTAIVAVMSGCFVQRGDVAIADPYFRAKTALLGGYDLILELPFPFSICGAEAFSRAAVELIDALGCVEAVAFGSECGDLDALSHAADLLASETSKEKFRALQKTENGRRRGASDLIRELLSDADPAVFGNGIGPNDLLAVGYLKTMKILSSEVEPLVVKRIGGRYDSDRPDHPDLVGATALRSLLNAGNREDFYRYIPAESKTLWKKALNEGLCPASFSPRLSGALLASLIAADPVALARRTGLDGGFVSRLVDAAQNAVSLDDLIVRASSRSVSYSQVRRMIFAAWLGFTSPGPDDHPLYSRVFGFTDKGQEVLRTVKRDSPLPILTKTADWVALPGTARDQAEFSLSADRFFGLALPSSRPASDAFRGSPCHLTGKTD